MKATGNSILAMMFVGMISMTGIFSFSNLKNYYVNEEAATTERTIYMDDKLEADLLSVLWQKNNYVNINGFVNNALQVKEMNGVVKMNNGTLYTYNSDIEKNPDVSIAEQNARKLIELNEHLQSEGIALYYVLAPSAVSKYDNQLPFGVIDSSNAKMDAFIKVLEEDGNVSYIDLRETMHEEGINQYDLYYRTDHHWNVYGGMYAAEKITDHVKMQYGIEMDKDIFDLQNYSVETYPKQHLGSKGQRVGKYYAGIDDFDILYPKYETQISRTLLSTGDTDMHDFSSAFIRREPLEKKDDTSRYTYDFVFAYTFDYEFVNQKADNDITVSCISDSMGRVVIPFLSLAVRDVYTNGSVREIDKMIEEQKPDMIVMILYATNIYETTDYFDYVYE